jgi:prepilin-type N-terminal cleavage/methylation domain-containing protein
VGNTDLLSKAEEMQVVTMNQSFPMRGAERRVERNRVASIPTCRFPAPARWSRRRGGFTLVELLVVIIIISILLGFIFVASMEAAHRAEERATQSLIVKLETGLNDRFEALLQNVPDPNFAHGYLAAIFYQNIPLQSVPPLVQLNPTTGQPVLNANGLQIPNTALTQTLRARVFATYDFIKSELPDVFYVQDPTGTITGYPLNFAANPYPGNPIIPLGNYILPLGNSIQGPYTANNTGFGDGNYTNPNLGLAGSGIYGASYAAASGIYKNLGYQPAGYDGVDSNNDGLIDNWAENNFTPLQAEIVQGNLGRHTHNTARSEMLYAILVEGRGPLGSVFSRDDFTDKEVQDTDNDGLPEFVDAWGQPLQFFRWPLLYHSDIQRGQLIVSSGAPVDQSLNPPGTLLLPYKNVIEEREQDPLDVNQQLMAPSWWSSGISSGVVAANSSSPFASLPGFAVSAPFGASGGVQAFEYFFHRLTEPLSPSAFTGAYVPQPWDRGSYPNRRAFYSKFLILSGGLDQQPGVFLYSDTAMQGFGANAALPLIFNENHAMPFALDVVDFTNFTAPTIHNPTTIVPPSSYDPSHPNSYDLTQAAGDDITNQNIQSSVGIGGSG